MIIAFPKKATKSQEKKVSVQVKSERKNVMVWPKTQQYENRMQQRAIVRSPAWDVMNMGDHFRLVWACPSGIEKMSVKKFETRESARAYGEEMEPSALQEASGCGNWLELLSHQQ